MIVFALVVVLQVWLMSIVAACWRYFRAKRAFGYTGTSTSMSYVIRGENGINSVIVIILTLAFESCVV